MEMPFTKAAKRGVSLFFVPITVAPEFGNCARNNLRGPKQVNIDFSTIKDFRITERQSLQFRMEMFNAPNHVELGNPATGWGSSNVLPQATFEKLLKDGVNYYADQSDNFFVGNSFPTCGINFTAQEIMGQSKENQ